MTATSDTHPDYSHGLLVHDTDDELIAETRKFVAQGLGSGGLVLVHGPRDRVALMRDALGAQPGLEYGFDEELYLQPTETLFAYQRRLAERPERTVFWVTGTIPLGHDGATQAAWNRYESAVNRALAAYPFRALCTYDTRTRPPSVIAAARAAHPTLSVAPAAHDSPEYLDPAAFLAGPLARVPAPPMTSPCAGLAVTDLDELSWARHLLYARAVSDSALPSETIEEFMLAVHEVTANGLVHGRAPVQVTLWADVGTLTCRIEDAGPGKVDPMTGYRYPDRWGPIGLWAARQLVGDLFIDESPSGGCRVLLTAT
jgi:anti-sigma regulatory factor (Ser/Thr protein kinase)